MSDPGTTDEVAARSERTEGPAWDRAFRSARSTR